MKIVAAISLFLMYCSSPPQRLEVVPAGELQQKREQVKQALAAWHKADSGIEGRIFRLKSDQALRELDLAFEKARIWLEARDAYNQSMVRQAAEQVNALQSLALSSGSTVPAEELLASAQRRLDDLDLQEKELAAASSRREDGLPYERQVLIDEQIQAQLKKIAELRENLREQQDLIRRTRETSKPLEAAGGALLNHSREVLRVLEDEKSRASAEGALWQEYYQSLKDLVRNGVGPRNTSGEKPAKKKP